MEYKSLQDYVKENYKTKNTIILPPVETCFIWKLLEWLIILTLSSYPKFFSHLEQVFPIWKEKTITGLSLLRSHYPA